MSGGSNNGKDNKAEKGGWASKFLKVAGAVAATAAVAGSLYIILKQPEADVSPYRVRQTHGHHHHDDDDDDDDDEEEEEEVVTLRVDGSLKREKQSAAVAGSLYSILNQPKADVAPYRVRQTHHREEKKVILKVDGSVLRKVPSAGCGGYLSSASQTWICGFVQKLKFTPNLKEHETEKEAILRGMRWVKKMGLRNVVVKSDCKNVVEFVNSGRRSNDRVICDIRDFLNCSHWQATLTWIRRDENVVADKLADKAHNYGCYSLHQFQNRSDIL